MDYAFIWKNKFTPLKNENLQNQQKISLYLLQNKIHQMSKLLSKIELIKYVFFSVKLHAFRVKNFDMLKNEILKKQTKNTKF